MQKSAIRYRAVVDLIIKGLYQQLLRGNEHSKSALSCRLKVFV